MSEPHHPYRAGRSQPEWDGDGVQALRRHLGLTQRELADELGVRQQTVSEWETGMYRPRGASRRLLGLVAERTGFAYEPAGSRHSAAQPPETLHSASAAQRLQMGAERPSRTETSDLGVVGGGGACDTPVGPSLPAEGSS